MKFIKKNALTEEPENRQKIENELLMGLESNERIPYMFDWREKARECFTKVAIKNQKYCGSCYSFAVTYAMAKRFCIKNPAAYSTLDLSVEDLLECDYKNLKCKGGIIPYTWEFTESTGVCSEACKPYYSGESKIVNECALYCSDYRQSYLKYKNKRYTLQNGRSDNDIKVHVFRSGPVVTGMTACPDLSMYRGGIYINVPAFDDAEKCGGHAITIVGWGYHSTYKNYWIVANSWGDTFGEGNGYFKIPFGHMGIGKDGGFASEPM